jgi:uncharacterized protein (DUF1330 family)
MKHYTVAELSVTDRGWARDYVADVTPMVERHGGRYLARTTTFAKLEGERDPAQIMLIIEWPDENAVSAFYESEEYRPYRERRRAGSTGEFVLVAGEDVNGLARIDD